MLCSLIYSQNEFDSACAGLSLFLLMACFVKKLQQIESCTFGLISFSWQNSESDLYFHVFLLSLLRLFDISVPVFQTSYLWFANVKIMSKLHNKPNRIVAIVRVWYYLTKDAVICFGKPTFVVRQTLFLGKSINSATAADLVLIHFSVVTTILTEQNISFSKTRLLGQNLPV